MQTFRTSQVAAQCGVHPNTVRLYEQLGFIPPVPRAGNGYRIYSTLHLEHVRLVRTVLRSTWLGGLIRQKALAVLSLSAAGSLEEAVREARHHLALVVEERKKAEIAAGQLEAWANGTPSDPGSAVCWRSKEVAERMDISPDTVRSWERNALITVPRNPDNGYRVYGDKEIRRLYVIRALRKARFSLMSIHRMLRHYDTGVRDGLAGILNELPPDEEDIFYNTNQWLTKIKDIEASTGQVLGRLRIIRNLLAK